MTAPKTDGKKSRLLPYGAGGFSRAYLFSQYFRSSVLY